MNILQSWKQSLSLFAPAHFAQFMRDVAWSTGDTYKILLSCWYLWLIPGLLWLYRGNLYLFASRFSNPLIRKFYGFSIHPVMLLIGILLLMIICLSARTSISPKNWHYFKGYGLYFCKLSLLVYGMSFILYGLLVYGLGYTYSDSIMLLETVFAGIFAPAYMLFYLDSNGSYRSLIQSFVRACILIVYKLPLLVVLFFGAYLIFAFPLIRVKEAAWSEIVRDVYTFGLLWPLIINIWTNLYNRTRYEQPQLYID